MSRTFTHELNNEVYSIAGHYELQKEEKIEHMGKEYLYLVGLGIIDSSCCGDGGCLYAIVPGSIVKWKSETNEKGGTTSEVEPIADQKIRDEIRQILLKKEVVNQVMFW